MGFLMGMGTISAGTERQQQPCLWCVVMPVPMMYQDHLQQAYQHPSHIASRPNFLKVLLQDAPYAVLYGAWMSA